jgi:hypothetical protein
MRGVIEEVRMDVRDGNPYLQILGVLPTMVDQRGPDHRAWYEEMVDVCRERQVRFFPPIPRRQSYARLSVAGHDYEPVADAIRDIVRKMRVTDAQGLSARSYTRIRGA